MRTVAFIPTDDLATFGKMEEKLMEFEPDLPLVQAKNPGIDPEYGKRTKSLWTQLLLREYDRVICIDPTVTIKAPFVKDIPDCEAYLFNYGLYPIPPNSQMPTVWNIHPMRYVHSKVFAVSSKRFAELWFKLAMSEHLNTYPRYEQDLLNIITYYGDFDVKFPEKPQEWHEIQIP